MKKLIALLPLLSVASPLAATFNHSNNNINLSSQRIEQVSFYVWAQHAMVEKNVKTIVGNISPQNWNAKDCIISNIKLNSQHQNVVMTVTNKVSKKIVAYTASYTGIKYNINQWTLITNSEINTWKKAARKTTVSQLFNKFPKLVTKYQWDVNKTKIASLHFSVNDDGTFFGAYLELSNSIKATANFYIQYQAHKPYDINDWQVQSLPVANNSKTLWARGFNNWVNSKGTNGLDRGALSLALGVFWEKSGLIPDYINGKESFNSIITSPDHLPSRYDFGNHIYTSFPIPSITSGDTVITGRIILLRLGRSVHINYIAQYVKGQPFNYKQIKPDFHINRDWNNWL